MRRVRSYMGEVRRASLRCAGGFAWSLTVVLVAGTFLACVAVAQTTQTDMELIETLRGQIKGAEAQHAGAAELGGLWLRLASRYQKGQEFTPAEDAYARALKLLRGSGAQAGYADALGAMASLELATGRMDKAKDSARKALAAYEALGNRTAAGYVHETIAMALLFGRHGREAEVESAAGLADLEATSSPQVDGLVSAHLTHSYALCFQKKYAAALEEVDRAMELARMAFPEESLEMVTAWSARGFHQQKMGAVEESERSMREALRLARGLAGVPQTLQVRVELGVMRRYDAFLKEAHRKQEATEVEAEIGKLEAAHPAGCSGCTVSVATLGFVP